MKIGNKVFIKEFDLELFYLGKKQYQAGNDQGIVYCFSKENILYLFFGELPEVKTISTIKKHIEFGSFDDIKYYSDDDSITKAFERKDFKLMDYKEETKTFNKVKHCFSKDKLKNINIELI